MRRDPAAVISDNPPNAELMTVHRRLVIFRGGVAMRAIRPRVATASGYWRRELRRVRALRAVHGEPRRCVHGMRSHRPCSRHADSNALPRCPPPAAGLNPVRRPTACSWSAVPGAVQFLARGSRAKRKALSSSAAELQPNSAPEVPPPRRFVRFSDPGWAYRFGVARRGECPDAWWVPRPSKPLRGRSRGSWWVRFPSTPVRKLSAFGYQPSALGQVDHAP